MVYPNFKNKHLEESLFLPEDYLKFAYKDRKKFPHKWVLVFQKSVEKYIRRKFKLKKDKENRLAGNLYIHKGIGFLKMGGIGSPHAVTLMEELIGLGGKEFIIVGTAGGLQNFGIFLCNKAIRDEGTSYHYIPTGKYSFPNDNLSKRFGKSIKKFGLDFEEGATWTIDAPYRETKAEVQHYKKEGVKSVEMESSALFAVAQVRKVKIAAAFVVSDLLGSDGWDPQFDQRHVKTKLYRLIDASVDCLSK